MLRHLLDLQKAEVNTTDTNLPTRRLSLRRLPHALQGCVYEYSGIESIFPGATWSIEKITLTALRNVEDHPVLHCLI